EFRRVLFRSYAGARLQRLRLSACWPITSSFLGHWPPGPWATKPTGVRRAATRMRISDLAAALACLTAVLTAVDGSSSELQWSFARGINLSSGSFNPERTPGIYGKDYTYPSPQDLDYYAHKG